MRDLLDALGVVGAVRRAAVAVSIWLGFAVGMVTVAGVQGLVEAWWGVPAVGSLAWTVVVWLAWTWWHSVLFDRHRRELIARLGPVRAYRRAFLTDIFPGIVIGFSQMLRTGLNGEALHRLIVSGPLPWLVTIPQPLVAVCVAAVIAAVSLALFAAAWRTLGAARVGFAEEFLGPDRFLPVVAGPYARMRHPLFWAGVGLSCSLALMVGMLSSALIAVCNVVYGLVYNRLEDRRLLAVYGERYAGYAEAVPHLVALPARLRAHRRIPNAGPR